MDSLRPERSLLDPKFEGYKLSPDPLPCDRSKLVSRVNDIALRDDLFSLQHIRAFGNYNHLIRDSWRSGLEERVYFVDANYKVQEATVKGQCVDSIKSVYRIPGVEKDKETLNASLAFPSDSFACLGDGNGKLYIIHTGCRSTGTSVEWKLVLSYQFDRPFIILHSLQEESSGTISCLLLSTVDKRTDVNVKESYTVLLDMAVFSQVSSLGSISCSCEMIQHFKGLRSPMYAALEPGNAAILVASETPFHLVKDSEKTTLGSEAIQELEEKATAEVVYHWSQTAEDLTVRFDLPVGSQKGDFSCEIRPDSIDVSLVGGQTLLRGQLFARIDSEASTWTFTDDILELNLQKQIGEHHWSSVVLGDDRGHYDLVGEEAKRVQEIHERLEHLTSDKLNPDRCHMAFDPQQLEECDAFPEDAEYVYRLDTRTGEVTHKVCLASHQWLFSATVKPQLPPIFSVRHDVDALLWQPEVQSDGKLTWTHVGTFNALGYVQASKENRKFSSCSADMKYAVLCDHTRHVYIYRQPSEDSKVAYQHVVTLEGSDNSILGLQASNSGVYILTPQTLHFIKVSDC